MTIEKHIVKDDEPVAQDIKNKEDAKTKEAKREYAKEQEFAGFHEDILRDKNNDGYNN